MVHCLCYYRIVLCWMDGGQEGTMNGILEVKRGVLDPKRDGNTVKGIFVSIQHATNVKFFINGAIKSDIIHLSGIKTNGIKPLMIWVKNLFLEEFYKSEDVDDFLARVDQKTKDEIVLKQAEGVLSCD